MDSPLNIHVSGTGYEGFVVIDSILHNTSSGGVRIASDLDPREIGDLAREMTLKYSLFRLPRGGAKSGVRMDTTLPAEEKIRIIQDFGRSIAPIVRLGIYNPGMDMNCGPEELIALYQGAGVAISHPTDTSYFTALTAMNAIEASAAAMPGSPPYTVAIEGFGSVGRHLAEMLPHSRFHITGISTIAGAVFSPEGFSPDQLVQAREKHGDELVRQLPGEISHEELFKLEVDFLVPSARTGVLTESLGADIRARAVVPVANAPYRTGVADQLQERGILCLPGYLCNAGGVFGSSMYDSGIPVPEVQDLLETRYRPLVHRLLDYCLETKQSPVRVVEDMALREARRRATLVDSKSLAGKIRARLSRRLPRSLRRMMVRRNYQDALASLGADVEALAR